MIRINDQQFWLYAAADPQTNELFHARLFAVTTSLSRTFSHANCGRNTISKRPYFSLVMPNASKLHCNDLGSDFGYVATKIGTVSNASFES